MKIRFSIRDILWLTVVAALLVASWVDRQRLKAQIDEQRQSIAELKLWKVVSGRKIESLKDRNAELKRALQSHADMRGGIKAKDSTMATNQRWANIHTLIGWTAEAEDTSDAVKNAHLKRHPRHDSYIPSVETKPLSKSEEDEYEVLNHKMHEQLRRVSKEHFAGTPPPPGFDPEHSFGDYFTPFTYQNYDWYGPTYECYICVRTDYISADLLRRFQSLLSGEFKDWCIQVVGCSTPDFHGDFEIAVFSDQIIVPKSALLQLGLSRANKE